jgi:hypothetical protein
MCCRVVLYKRTAFSGGPAASINTSTRLHGVLPDNILSNGNENVKSNIFTAIYQPICAYIFQFCPSLHIFRPNLSTHFLSLAFVLHNRRRTAKKLHIACPLEYLASGFARLFASVKSLAHSLTYLYDDSVQGRLGIVSAARPIPAPRCSHGDCVCPASGKPSVMAGTNMSTLLGTAVQSKLQQLSHGTANSAGEKRLMIRGRGEGMKGRKE